MLSQDEVWNVLTSFFKDMGLTRQQIDSYDVFLNVSIRQIIRDSDPIVIEVHPENADAIITTVDDAKYRCFVIKFLNACSEKKPTDPKLPDTEITPQQCRLRKVTYSTMFYTDLMVTTLCKPTGERNAEELVTFNGKQWELEDTQLFEQLELARIPLMVRCGYCHLSRQIERLKDMKQTSITADDVVRKAGECPLDQGGYFIIRGSEKVLISQENRVRNQSFVIVQQDGSLSVEVDSLNPDIQHMPANLKIELTAQGLTVYWDDLYKDSKSPLPLVILLKALGVDSIREAVELIVYDESDIAILEVLSSSLDAYEELFNDFSQDRALDVIAIRLVDNIRQLQPEERIQRAREKIDQHVLPHIGSQPLQNFSQYHDFESPDIIDPNERFRRMAAFHTDKRRSGSNNAKAKYIGHMCNKLLSAIIGRELPTDRDHYGMKRLDLAGTLVESLFRQLFYEERKRLSRSLQRYLRKNSKMDGNTLKTQWRPTSISEGLRWSLSTGNWGVRTGTLGRKGVAQKLERLTYLLSLSYLRRVVYNKASTGKSTRMRQLHNTQWGMICPAETPEGAQVGLTKHLALTTLVSTTDYEATHRLWSFLDNRMEVLAHCQPYIFADMNVWKVFLNGDWIGAYVSEGEGDWLVGEFLERQRRGEFSWQVSVTPRTMKIPISSSSTQRREIHFYTDYGRPLRPIFVVNDGHLQCQGDLCRSGVEFKELIDNGCIEFIDVLGSASALIAPHVGYLKELHDIVGTVGETAEQQEEIDQHRLNLEQFTHCEIHPSMILGVCASVIPFPDHNQSPRNTYQSAMGKQAMGVYMTNFEQRMDPLGYILHYPQRPLVFTRPMEYLRFLDLPAGQNIIVAVLCYTGFNQEDSLIMSRSSLDRGLFRSSSFRTYIGEEDTTREKQQFEKPDPAELEFGYDSNGAWKKNLDVDGLITPDVTIGPNEILIGRTIVPSQEMEGLGMQKKIDASIRVRSTEAGYVDRVVITKSEDDNLLGAVRIRMPCIPEVGDKFSSRHGQKGVIGITFTQADMPFSCNGISPDLIMNPHAIPSRMTVGQLIECLLSKVAVFEGILGDGTAFNELNVGGISQRLHDLGQQRYGHEALYNGFTGQRLSAVVFFGPTFYQRLKHLVHDKLHSRARGPLATITKQPLKGRSRMGGTRVGEMERDAIIAHGCTEFLLDRMFHNADADHVLICDHCGMFADSIFETGTQVLETAFCRSCRSKQIEHTVSVVPMPRAALLLFHELMAMHILPRFDLEDS
ncbi:hypothetical protein PCE1_003087 [Barthelona sp. PCE]